MFVSKKNLMLVIFLVHEMFLRQHYVNVIKKSAQIYQYIYTVKIQAVAHVLHYFLKRGYNQIYQLQGGFKTWTGKIKAKNINSLTKKSSQRTMRRLLFIKFRVSTILYLFQLSTFIFFWSRFLIK